MKYFAAFLLSTSLLFSSCAFVALGVGLALSTDSGRPNMTNAYNNFPYQKTDKQYANKYTDQLESNGSLVKSWYHYTVEFVDEAYVLKKYYPETERMTDYYTYNTSMLFIKEGVCKEWWDNGNKKIEGSFKNNKRSGEWTFYDSNGLITKKGFFRKGLREGKWTFYKIEEKPLAVFNYSNDERNGPFELFESEKSIAKGTFFQGELEAINWNTTDSSQYQRLLENSAIDQTQTDQTAAIEACTDFDFEERRAECTKEKLTKIIQEGFEYPSFDFEKEVEGKALIGFTIDTEGQLSDIKILRGLSKTIAEECLRVAETLPKKWIPAKKNGKNIAINYILPIKLKIPRPSEPSVLENNEN
ncbi:MAG: energy transducer TonB [Saprospiraceae bacterium]